MYIRLKIDREKISNETNWGEEIVFLHAGEYQLIREVKGLGWIVKLRSRSRGMKEITTIIRYENGEKNDI